MFRTKCKEHDHSSFYKFLQMEHNQKNTDCYFYYYSTCKKGDFCPFRHEPSALGCETVCTYWQQGNCLNEHCSFRHMELKKNRKAIACYWEMQPMGCKKPHCPFLHKNARLIANNPTKTAEVTTKSPNQEWLSHQNDTTKFDGSTVESDQGRGSSEASSFIGSPAVDPLIVKFEEDQSDDESENGDESKPIKRIRFDKHEQKRLKEIQAEVAAYYAVPIESHGSTSRRSHRNNIVYINNKRKSDSLDFKILTIDEIRNKKRKTECITETTVSFNSTTIQES